MEDPCRLQGQVQLADADRPGPPGVAVAQARRAWRSAAGVWSRLAYAALTPTGPAASSARWAHSLSRLTRGVSTTTPTCASTSTRQADRTPRVRSASSACATD